MKRIIGVLVCVALLVTAGGCQQNGETTEASNQEEVSAAASGGTEASAEPIQPGEKLQNSFVKLWDGTGYEMDVTMLVESEEGLPPDTSENSKTTDGVMKYHYQVAVDQNTDRAMLLMEMPDGTVGHLVIDNQVCYKLNDEEKTVEKQTYPYNAYSFGQLYTTELFLGITRDLQLTDSGSREVKLGEAEKQELAFESYRFVPEEQASQSFQDMTVTYYFQQDKPFGEVVETARGKTTFVFQKVSDSIREPSVFEIPSDYTDVSANGNGAGQSLEN